MSEPRTLTLKVPTPESLGLALVNPGCWDSTSKNGSITILENVEGAKLYVDSSLHLGIDGLEVQLPSLDHALVALALILGKVA